MLVQSLAPLHHPDGCRDAGYGWHLDHRGYGFKYSAECGRDAEYLKRCSHAYKLPSYPCQKHEEEPISFGSFFSPGHEL